MQSDFIEICRRRRFPLIWFFFAFLLVVGRGHHSYGTDIIDSLQTRLILAEDQQKLVVYDALIPYLFRNDALKAKSQAEAMQALSEEVGNQPYNLRAQLYIGLVNSKITSDYDHALGQCQQVASAAVSQGFVDEHILSRIAIADIYRLDGDLTAALSSLLRANQLVDSADREELLPRVLNKQAIIYTELQDYENGLLVLKRAQRHATLNDLHFELANTHILYGDLYSSRINYELAEEHYGKALELYEKQNYDLYKGIALEKLASCYFAKGDVVKAFDTHAEALNIRRRLKDRTGLAESFNKIGLICIELGEYQRAIDNVILGLQNAEMLNSNALMQQSFDYLYQAYLGLRDYENALAYQEKYVSMSELLFAEASERRIKEIENRNEIKARDAQIKALEEIKLQNEKELATTRVFIIILVVLLLAILGLGFVLIRSNRDKRKVNAELEQKNEEIVEQNEQLTELNSQKDRFFSIIGHDLKEPLNSLSSFSSLLINHTSNLSEDEIRKMARELDNSLKNLFELLDNLLGWAQSQTSGVELNPDNFKLAPVIRENIKLLSKAALNKKIRIMIQIEDQLEVFADQDTIRTVVRNLISNAIKFTSQQGMIKIKVDEWKDVVEIAVEDNGMGMTEVEMSRIFDVGSKHTTLGTNNEKGTGLGLILCKEYVEKNGGTISVESKKGVGSTFKFTLPKMQAAENEVPSMIQS